MREMADWCDRHQIPFITKFKYRNDFPIKVNLWNIYSYGRFLIEKNLFIY